GVMAWGAVDAGAVVPRRYVQVTVRASCRADADVLVRILHVQLILVRLRVDRDRLDTKLAARVDDAQSDFTAIGDEDFLEHYVVLIANSRSPYCTGCPFST